MGSICYTLCANVILKAILDTFSQICIHMQASVNGSTHVPLFRPDTGLDPASLMKQMSAFGMGGWWLGGTHMQANESFMAEVQNAVPKDAKVVVGCQKGLR